MNSPTTTSTSLCIAGAHRSGTSMVARLLHRCGLDLGPESELMPAQADNPDGFWEHLGFVALNDELLNELGGAWDLPPRANENFDDARLEPLRLKAKWLIEQFDSAPAWGWKDPRNSLTLPFWKSLLADVKTMVMVRNPLEVAYSMRQRNGTSYSFGLRLWEIYNRRLIETTSSQERLVSHYDLFFDDVETELRRIADFAGLPDADVHDAAALMTKRRRHTYFTLEHLIDARVAPEVIELYRALIAEASPMLRDSGRKANTKQSTTSEGVELLPGAVTRLNAFIPETNVQIQQLYRELFSQAEARHKMQLAKLEAQNKSQVDGLTAHLEELKQLLRDRSISLAKSEAQGDELRNRLRVQLQATKRLSRLMEDVDDAAARLRSSRRWKLASPVTAIKAKLSPGKVSVGYGHLEKIVEAHSQWRASHPEITKIDEEIKALKLPILFELVQPQFKIPRELALPGNPTPVDVKAIAFYLPQFHRIPENDAWWGEGFTEWTNVRRGSANFRGHYQPHVPAADLGYYDLTNEGVLEKQAALAGAAGIYGFCFHYYWFGGEVLLDFPVRKILETGKPELPFCICWANENWTRRWDGMDSEILIAQRHSPEDDLNFIRHVEKILTTKNYIRVDGKPLLLVYRPSLLPEVKETLQRWRSYFRAQGHGDLQLVMAQSFSERAAPSDYGFDAVVQFPPHFTCTAVTSLIPDKSQHFTGIAYDYGELRKKAINQFRSAPPNLTLYPGVMPSWDNTGRRQSKSTIWVNSSPEAYSEWLAEVAGLARDRLPPQQRFIFINAWNEWAEGCHLEPDERFGYAWLNATSLALRGPFPVSKSGNPISHPDPPPETSIPVRPLSTSVKVAVSVLFYHREDILAEFVRKLLPQLEAASKTPGLSCELYLSFNYEPSAEALTELRQLIHSSLASENGWVHIVENRFNLGFGGGHNAIFEKTDSDVFIVLNSDLHIEDDDWLGKFVQQLRNSNVAIVGVAKNASRLREDGCGVPVIEAEAPFDFVDGSLLAIRSDLAKRFGLFSPSFDYFYFEDADLNLRYRQMGLQIALLDVPYTHERSSSSRQLPQFAVESVLNRNRARFFEKWGKYLCTRTLSNRVGIRFVDIDRQLQCASLPALFGLLAEHRTAVIDFWGVHEQLAQFFKHPRIRLITSWQTLREDDYLRYYELATDQSETPRVYDIANRMGCDPNFEATKVHLESLMGSSVRENSRSSKTALLYVARKSPLFDGKEPAAESFAPVAKMLREKNFEVRFYTDYGMFEVQSLHNGAMSDWNYVAVSPGVELLKEVAAADLLVTSDNWIGQLGQLLHKRTFLWLGAASSAAVIWDFERVSCFADQSLPCLGCYHQFGRDHHNVCLRGDIACMNSRLNGGFVASLEAFLEGKRLKAADIRSEHLDSRLKRTMRSEQLSLEEHWPRSTANSVLVLTPVNPNLDERVLQRAKELANRAINGMPNYRIVYDNLGDAPLRGQPHPHRQAAMASLRQNMVERHLRDEKWIFWVDADIIDYPANLLEQLISRIEGGIAAPVVIMEGNLDESANPAGFGPGRFYDVAGFVERGRWARFTPPYFDQIGPVYELESVGSCYLVNADIYRWGGRHEIDVASSNFVSTNSRWSEDAVRRNQEAKANCFTEHYSICAFTRSAGLPVRAFGDLIAYHQKS